MTEPLDAFAKLIRDAVNPPTPEPEKQPEPDPHAPWSPKPADSE